MNEEVYVEQTVNNMTLNEFKEKRKELQDNINDAKLDLVQAWEYDQVQLSVAAIADAEQELEEFLDSASFYDEWYSEYGVETERLYELYKDEYGDAMQCFLSDFLKQKYREFQYAE